MAAEGGWVGFIFERVETKSVVRAGRADRTIVFLFAFTDAAERRADRLYGTVGIRHAQVPPRCRLRIALVATTQEAASVT